MSAQQGAAHTRDNRGLLAAAEKQLLIAIARRLHPSIHSDHLSGLGLGSMAVAGAAFAAWPLLGWWAPAVVIAALAANWFGDSLDGTVARVRNQQRPRYGYYVDHVIDLAGTSFLMGGLALSGLMHPAIAIAVLCAYVLVCAEVYLATHVTRVFKMSFLGFGPTELRIVLALGVLKAAMTPVVDLPAFGSMALFDIGGIVAAAGMGGAFIVSSVANARALYQQEPMPRRQPDARAA
jgi:phosphatidylglycerophosphate synthase